MTPAEHATAAANLLAVTDPTTSAAMAATVHAVLAKTTGTSADYTAAETALDSYTAGGAHHDYALALAHAELA